MSDSTELLRSALARWGALHGRRVEDEAITVWLELFVNHPEPVLEKAIREVSKIAERMPTPGLLTRELLKAYEAEPWLSPHFKATPTYVEGHDGNGMPCVFWSDDPRTPAYAAKDCPEGRAYLALMREWKDEKKPALLVCRP